MFLLWTRGYKSREAEAKAREQPRRLPDFSPRTPEVSNEEGQGRHDLKLSGIFVRNFACYIGFAGYCKFFMELLEGDEGA